MKNTLFSAQPKCLYTTAHSMRNKQEEKAMTQLPLLKLGGMNPWLVCRYRLLRRDRTGRRVKGDRTQLGHLTQTDASNISYHTISCSAKILRYRGRSGRMLIPTPFVFPSKIQHAKAFFPLFWKWLTSACWWEEWINFLFCTQLLLSILGWNYLHPQVFLPSFYLLCLERSEWVAVWVWCSCLLDALSQLSEILAFWLPNVWKSL